MPDQIDDDAPRIVRAKPVPRTRHFLEVNPPPPIQVFTVQQTEDKHPALKGRLRQWIKRADADDPDFRWLRECIIRVARTVLVDDVRLRDELHQRSAMPPAPARRNSP